MVLIYILREFAATNINQAAAVKRTIPGPSTTLGLFLCFGNITTHTQQKSNKC